MLETQFKDVLTTENIVNPVGVDTKSRVLQQVTRATLIMLEKSVNKHTNTLSPSLTLSEGN